MIRCLVYLIVFSLPLTSKALSIHSKVERAFLNQGGSRKALSHLKCFLNNYGDQNFNLKKAQLADRCNGENGLNRNIQINNTRYVVLVDYTKKSNRRRLFVLDLERPQHPYVEKFYAAHGKYKASSYTNKVKGINANTVEEIDYFSNVKNSAASSSGFYITGQIYQGRWVGPQGDKFSQILHGISKDLNDNACDRAIVLHGNSSINESGTNEGVKSMSAGCIMLDYGVVNQVIAKIRGGGGKHYPNEARVGGVLLFSYGNTEATLPSNYYCTPASQKSLRL